MVVAVLWGVSGYQHAGELIPLVTPGLGTWLTISLAIKTLQQYLVKGEKQERKGHISFFPATSVYSQQATLGSGTGGEESQL